MSFEPGAPIPPSANAYSERLAVAHALRGEIAQHSNCYRVHDADADAIAGLTVERYGEFAVVHAYRGDIEQHAEEVARGLCSLGAQGVYLKRRRRGDLRKLLHPKRELERPLVGAEAPAEFAVHEHDRRYLVRLGEGIATGLFVDQRENRNRVEHGCHGRRVLNLFCYTGSFSVAAGRGGALQVVSVDSSRAALARLDANLRLNELDPAQHRLLRADAPSWLERAVRRGERFDFVVLDPPTFSGGNAKTFSAEQQYQSLVTNCLLLCAPGARLLCVTNHRGTSSAALQHLIERAARAAARPLTELVVPVAPRDCPPGRSGESATKSCIATLR